MWLKEKEVHIPMTEGVNAVEHIIVLSDCGIIFFFPYLTKLYIK